MAKCQKCMEYDLKFDAEYGPADYIEGDPDSSVWIVGLNPKYDGKNHTRSLDQLKQWPEDHDKLYSYFKDFKKVSEDLFYKFGKPGGTAHTDIVKCASESFPTGYVCTAVVNNCKRYLMSQLEKHKPKIIVCNGSDVSKFMLTFLKPPEDFKRVRDTSYWADLKGTRTCVILSGFIGRIDDFAKRRLGREIESRINELNSYQTSQIP